MNLGQAAKLPRSDIPGQERLPVAGEPDRGEPFQDFVQVGEGSRPFILAVSIRV